MELPLQRRNGAFIWKRAPLRLKWSSHFDPGHRLFEMDSPFLLVCMQSTPSPDSTLGPVLICMLHQWRIFAIIIIVGYISQTTCIRKLKNVFLFIRKVALIRSSWLQSSRFCCPSSQYFDAVWRPSATPLIMVVSLREMHYRLDHFPYCVKE
jgi:hypothetical protein